MWDYRLSDDFVSPIKGLYYQDSAFYFFCMDNNISLVTYLLKATDQSQSATVERNHVSIIYPLASCAIDDGFLLESNNRESYSTRLTKLNSNFGEQWHE